MRCEYLPLLLPRTSLEVLPVRQYLYLRDERGPSLQISQISAIDITLASTLYQLFGAAHESVSLLLQLEGKCSSQIAQ